MGGYTSGTVPGNMSFNPYHLSTTTPNNLNLVPGGKTMELLLTNDNNDTKMSNNEAFLAFLSKNDGTDDEW